MNGKIINIFRSHDTDLQVYTGFVRFSVNANFLLKNFEEFVIFKEF